jgi:hypothetical protein
MQMRMPCRMAVIDKGICENSCCVRSWNRSEKAHLIILVGETTTQKFYDTLHSLHPAIFIIIPRTFVITVHFLMITPVSIPKPTVRSRTAGVIIISIVPKTHVSFQHELRLFVCVFCSGLKVLLLGSNITWTPSTSYNLLVVLLVKNKRFGCRGHPVAFVA